MLSPGWIYEGGEASIVLFGCYAKIPGCGSATLGTWPLCLQDEATQRRAELSDGETRGPEDISTEIGIQC